MLFTIINSRRSPLKDRGYHFVEDSEIIYDDDIYELVAQANSAVYARKLTDIFNRGEEPICIGEDGVFYTVMFDDVSVDGGKPVSTAVMWKEIAVDGY